MSLFNSLNKDLKQQWTNGDPIIRLIFINICFFLIYFLVKIGINFSSPEEAYSHTYTNLILRWTGFSLSFPEFAYRPWTWISFQLMHADFFHILWNMLFLYWFGEILHSYIGTKRTYTLYFLGGLSGAILALIVLSFIPSIGRGFILIGASAGCSAIMLAAAAIAPDHTLYLLLIGPVRLKYLVLIKFILDLASFALLKNPGGSLSHIGGAAFGYLFIHQLQQGNDLDAYIKSIFTWLKKPFKKRKTTMKVEVQNTFVSREKRSTDAQKKIDAILDKINVSGYDSLSREEKEFLFKYSKD